MRDLPPPTLGERGLHLVSPSPSRVHCCGVRGLPRYKSPARFSRPLCEERPASTGRVCRAPNLGHRGYARGAYNSALEGAERGKVERFIWGLYDLKALSHLQLVIFHMIGELQVLHLDREFFRSTQRLTSASATRLDIR